VKIIPGRVTTTTHIAAASATNTLNHQFQQAPNINNNTINRHTGHDVRIKHAITPKRIAISTTPLPPHFIQGMHV
jgi:hypothetical protein